MVASKSLPTRTAEPNDSGGGSKGRITDISKADLEKELQYLPDPLKLASNTLNLLRQDDHIKALAVVRYASSKMPCTVSWNHIIDYNMSKGRVTPAMRTYNEMKKRAQPPDAYTYTILLRGLAANHRYPQSLPRALLVYNSMYAENSPVKPSIIHTNAVLNVCARANDIDALFKVAAKLPERGKGAPDNMTFTTIINALCNAALNPRLSAEQQERKRWEVVQQGCRMWQDIIGRWQNGEMLVDEEMVCAMARLLILGDTTEDCDDVLSLFEQMMRIPRLIPRLGDPARQTHLTPSKASVLFPLLDRPAEATDLEAKPTPQNSYRDQKESSSSLPSNHSSSPSLPRSVFDPVPLTSSSVPRSYPRPSNRSLSALVDACTRMSALRAASSYWKLLTSPPYSIIPDAESLHMSLRQFRVSRSSRQAVSLLSSMLLPRSTGGYGIPAQPKTFRIAMSTCVRDANNPSAHMHAITILNAMALHLEEPDLRTFEMFVSLLEKSAKADRRRPVRAGLDASQPVIANLRSLLAYGAFSEKDESSQEDLFSGRERKRATVITAKPDKMVTAASRSAVLATLRRVVRLYGRVLEGGKEELSSGPEYRALRDLRERRETLRAFVERWARKMGTEGSEEEEEEEVEEEMEEVEGMERMGGYGGYRGEGNGTRAEKKRSLKAGRTFKKRRRLVAGKEDVLTSIVKSRRRLNLA